MSMRCKVALLADLHLPFIETASQYKALEFAVESIERNKPDVIVSLGDMTACGDVCAAQHFLDIMNRFALPKLFVLGNSDIRTKENVQKIRMLESEKELTVNGFRLIGLNTADSVLKEDDKKLLATADEQTIVFLHHPPQHTSKASKAFFENWLESGTYKACVYGHLHLFEQDGKSYSIQALDPDKAIGEPPCVTYMMIDDEKISLEFDYFPCHRPSGIEDYIGLSCFDWYKDIVYAADHGIQNIELRPGVINCVPEALGEKVAYWRRKGGKYLSLHMPDFGYDNGIMETENWEKALRLANYLHVDGVTVHVPRVSVEKMTGDVKSDVLAFLQRAITTLPDGCVVGIENMHMTDGEKADESRRFGYIPEECLELVSDINDIFGYERVGVLLDVGHARNNPPYSQKYNISSWYALVGSQTVGYHIHQVLMTPDGMENHTAIMDVFGPLISYCSFSDCWNNGQINKKPVFLEIRGGAEQYIPTIETITKWK